MSRVQIDGELSIYQVANLKPQLQQALQQCKHAQLALEIDLSGMTECDGAGLQLLLSVSNSAGEYGLPIHLLGTSVAMNDLLAMYGLSNRFISNPTAAGSSTENAHE